MIVRFFRGASSLPRGAIFFLRNPSLWPSGIVPVLLTMGVFIIGAVAWFFAVDALVDMVEGVAGPVKPVGSGVGQFFAMIWYGILSGLHWALTHLRWLFFLIAGVIFFFFSFLAFVVVVNIIGAPWNDALCAKVENLVAGRTEEANAPFRQKFSELAMGIRHSLVRLLIYGTGVLVLLLVEWLSGGVATIVVTPIGIVWSIVFVALEFADIPESRRRKTLGAKFATLKANPSAMLGFGSVTYLILLVPVINVLVIPFAVTGITLLYLEQLE